jgi:hypothetical protein
MDQGCCVGATASRRAGMTGSVHALCPSWAVSVLIWSLDPCPPAPVVWGSLLPALWTRAALSAGPPGSWPGGSHLKGLKTRPSDAHRSDGPGQGRCHCQHRPRGPVRALPPAAKQHYRLAGRWGELGRPSWANASRPAETTRRPRQCWRGPLLCAPARRPATSSPTRPNELAQVGNRLDHEELWLPVGSPLIQRIGVSVR